MNLDEMITTWRAQNETPLYGINRDLLQLVIQHEQADIRRQLRLENWTFYGTSAFMLALLILFFPAIYFDDDPRTAWDYVAAGLGTLAILIGASSLWVSRKRQAMRERGFGNSLREEIRRNLSLIDYQLSLTGRWEGTLVSVAPITLAACLLYWLIIQINNEPFGAFHIGIILFIVGSTVVVVDNSRRTALRELLPRRQRLKELLEVLDAGE